MHIDTCIRSAVGVRVILLISIVVPPIYRVGILLQKRGHIHILDL
jgi:hypothetical protein